MAEARAHALDLESDLARHPDERGEILLEAAGEWERAGDLERARSLLTEVLALGDEDADWARYSLASICFTEGKDADAQAHLRVLAHRGAAAAGPAGLVAELLERRGEHEAALGWFDQALGPDAAGIADAVRQRRAPSLDDIALHGRQRCRAKLGLPPDELDRAADVAEQNRRGLAEALERAARAQAGPAGLEMLIWPRVELERAAKRWPAIFTRTDNQADVERELQRLSAEHNLAAITLIVGNAGGFAEYLDTTGADGAQESTRLAYAAQVKSDGGTTPWPPGRNQRCWCGSMRKYKQCCGGPRR